MKNFETSNKTKPISNEHDSRTTDGERRIIQKGSMATDPIAPPQRTSAASRIAIAASRGQEAISETTKAGS